MKVATFATLINQKVFMLSPRTQYIAVHKDHLVDYLKPVLGTVYVDTDWYLLTNPDIVEAIRSGAVENAVDHYVTFGFYEHRMPYEIKVDENWYLIQYPDVKDAVAKGSFPSGESHFYAVGFKEGRLPHANFSLRTL